MLPGSCNPSSLLPAAFPSPGPAASRAGALLVGVPSSPVPLPRQHLRSLMPKQLAHSSRAMYLSLSRSQASKKRVVQCSMGMRGARSGASSVWDRYLPR